MAIATCMALLLLTIFPLQAIAGRHLPAPPPASSTQSLAVQTPAARHVGRGGALGGTFVDGTQPGTQFQDRSPPPHRKLLLGLKEVKRDIVDSIYGHRLLVGSSPLPVKANAALATPAIQSTYQSAVLTAH